MTTNEKIAVICERLLGWRIERAKIEDGAAVPDVRGTYPCLVVWDDGSINPWRGAHDYVPVIPLHESIPFAMEIIGAMVARGTTVTTHFSEFGCCVLAGNSSVFGHTFPLAVIDAAHRYAETLK